MIKYRNISLSAKTFYGVRFEPGEVKEVPGYINCSSMIRIFDKHKTDYTKVKISNESVVSVTKRGRKKSSETEKVTFAETESNLETISKEETTNGNPS